MPCCASVEKRAYKGAWGARAEALKHLHLKESESMTCVCIKHYFITIYHYNYNFDYTITITITIEIKTAYIVNRLNRFKKIQMKS